MPSIETFITFLLALTLLEISPGPDMMLTIARGVGQGRRIALLTVLGNVFVAGFVQVSFLVLGLVTVVNAWPFALDLLRWVGAAYLIWLGIKMIATSGTDTRLRKIVRISDWQAVKEGALNSLTNPKSLLFMFAFLPQFVDPTAGPVWLQLLVLGSIQKLAGIVSLGSVAMASGTFGNWLGKHPAFIKWQERFTGVVMVALGIRMLFGGSGVVSVQAK
ncbi:MULTISPECIES: LysE family translocator [Enterobacteriaceae]|uniref:LysE family translocator n=1 Tax=Enterobacteriaceae TaxID=543 RepID=UPI0004E3D07C|nr:LysE family translocator [Kluyvera ascorbata]EJG2189502.1 LysE family translocator [Citrobacter freundii]ELC7078839.1 LysE family translocator [Salmonella enterica]EJG2190946.1 LysE family translocator [Citrobacter freundii]EJG2388880.1 LysE family translocator [Kluyvera ascorbata]KFC96604.1 LysE family export protein [Kluyvera ascorbata ATCC 33433]